MDWIGRISLAAAGGLVGFVVGGPIGAGVGVVVARELGSYLKNKRDEMPGRPETTESAEHVEFWKRQTDEQREFRDQQAREETEFRLQQELAEVEFRKQQARERTEFSRNQAEALTEFRKRRTINCDEPIEQAEPDRGGSGENPVENAANQSVDDEPSSSINVSEQVGAIADARGESILGGPDCSVDESAKSGNDGDSVSPVASRDGKLSPSPSEGDNS